MSFSSSHNANALPRPPTTASIAPARCASQEVHTAAQHATADESARLRAQKGDTGAPSWTTAFYLLHIPAYARAQHMSSQRQTQGYVHDAWARRLPTVMPPVLLRAVPPFHALSVRA
ncbi:hypothetical protein K438DRAFT_1977620 [Mycena galopus ATCC 62051]|nr:hypothetical protein K438DRAFT_1977620 [Mycena galopus ATCC 62051]